MQDQLQLQDEAQTSQVSSVLPFRAQQVTRQKLYYYITVYGLLTVVTVIAVLPLMWAFAASFTPNSKVFEYAYPFTWRALLPVDFTIEAYEQLFARGFGRSILNTLFLGATGVIVGGTFSAMAGFAFARFDFYGKNVLFVVVVLLTFVVPIDLIAIPRFILVNELGWNNTWPGLIIPNLASSMAIFLFRQFFSEIPQELIDATRVDGASWFRVFFGIVIPISKPVLISAGLLLFLVQWDAFFWPLLVAPAAELRVVQVDISFAVEQYQTLWNQLMAGSILAALIPIILVIPFQRYYVRAILGTGLSD